MSCVCLSQVCEVQTSQSDVRDGQHAAKGAAGKVTAALVMDLVMAEKCFYIVVINQY